MGLRPLPPQTVRPLLPPTQLPSEKSKVELWEVLTPATARATLRRLATGYPRDRTAAAVAPATTNATACWLASATDNQSGHVAVRPFVARSGRRVPNGSARTPRRSAQFVHRLAVLGWHEWGEVVRMVENGGRWEVSHLCGQGRCFNPLHLVVESHSANEIRKHLNGGICRCRPACIRP